MSTRFSLRALALMLLSSLVTTPIHASDPAPSGWAVPAVPTVGKTPFAIGDPSTFVSVPPCRVADTRAGSGFPPPYGPPSIPGGGTQRTFTITGQCDIPSGAQAVSFNFAVWGPPTRGDLRAFPTGTGTPLVSTLNWEAGILALANAAIVPLGTGGAITLQVDGPGTVDIFFDVNGYFLDKDGMFPAASSGQVRYLGVVGVADPVGGTSYGVLFAENKSTGPAYSLKADITNFNNNSAAIVGRQRSTAEAINYGIWGFNASASSSSAGVRGETSGPGYGVYSAGNFAASGVKAFVEPHPSDPAVVIRYVALEGPEAGTYFRGRGRFEGRVAHIAVPEDFRIVTDPEGLTVHLTPIGGAASTWVTTIGLDGIEAQSSRDVEFSYVVYGVRKAFRDFVPVSPGSDFMPESAMATMPAWLTDEARRRLISNGTYNADGTVNVSTARRLGWIERWQPVAP